MPDLRQKRDFRTAFLKSHKFNLLKIATLWFTVFLWRLLIFPKIFTNVVRKLVNLEGLSVHLREKGSSVMLQLS
jgi:E3 ubiquitin-protein ligase DOA10